MAEVEARPFLRGRQFGSSELKSDCGRSANKTRALRTPTNHRSRYRVLIIGDKRTVVYPRYRSSKTGTESPAYAGVYRGLPSAETVATLPQVSSAWVDTSGPAELSEDIPQIEVEMCKVRDNEFGEVKRAQTEWKLVDELQTI